MKKLNKNGFTVYSLVIAIAALAVLSAVIIPTFVGVVNKANENNYIQAKTAQQMVDMVAELDNESLLTWEDFEGILADKIANVNMRSDDAVKNALVLSLNQYLEAANSGNTLLTEDQVKLIIVYNLSNNIKDAQAEAVFTNAIEAAGASYEYVNNDNDFAGNRS
jgi:type II secretory pathway pseudopilin PulG